MIKEHILSGGYINKVIKKNNSIFKYFDVPSATNGIGQSPQQRMQNEIDSNTIFTELKKVKVPKIYNYNKDEAFIEFEALDGDPLERLLISNRSSFTPNILSDLIYDTGKILKNIHISYDGNLNDPINKYIGAIPGFLKGIKPILDLEGISTEKIEKLISKSKIIEGFEEFGLVRIHKDFQFNNIIYNFENGILGVIDWEFSEINSPYEDYASTQLFIINTFGFEDIFWKGYGKKPKTEIVSIFIIIKLIRILSSVSLDVYIKSDTTNFRNLKKLVLELKRITNQT